MGPKILIGKEQAPHSCGTSLLLLLHLPHLTWSHNKYVQSLSNFLVPCWISTEQSFPLIDFNGIPKEQIQFNPKAEFLGGVDSEQKGLLACVAKQVLYMMIACRVSDFVSHIIQISMVSIEN